MKILFLKKFLSLSVYSSNNKSKLNFYLDISSIFITVLSIIFIVLIISVNDGFKLVVNESLLNLNGKFKIYNKHNYKLTNNDYDKIISDLPNETIVSKISTKNLIVRSKNLSKPVNVVAFSSYDNFINKIENNLISGKISDNQILIGKILADRLNVNVGSELVFIKVDSLLIDGAERLVVGGIFNTNIPSYDKYLVYGNRELFKNFIDDNYDYFLTNYDVLNNDLLKDNYRITSIFDLNKNLFNWLESYDTPIKMLVVFILVICIFNILQSNFLYINRKEKDFYLLKTIGLNNRYIYMMILLRSFLILTFSCFIGFIISYLLLIIENNFMFINLPEYVYFTNSLPININYILPLYIFPFLIFILFTVSIYFYYNFMRKYEF